MIGIESTDRGEPRVRTAESLMRAFAVRTGIAGSGAASRRYLWTDAFAVCNFLALHRATGAAKHLDLAQALVESVHRELGRHRADAGRSGWISGLPEEEGSRHPTRGGLRIGKPLPERRAGEPHDDELEWERDGQYFHYLTRWMHALACMARATGEARFLEWAVDLATAAHAAFVVTDPRDGRRRMHWKMSIDLRRPLVASMGHHDPLDGLLTGLELQAAIADAPRAGAAASLTRIVDDFATMAARRDWTTDDPLGLGGLLAAAWTLARLSARGLSAPGCTLAHLLACSAAGLARFRHQLPLGPAHRRLAFRELGLAIGLHAVPRLAEAMRNPSAPADLGTIAPLLDTLRQHLPLAAAIEDFWLDPDNRETTTWLAHRDIDDVMLATSLVPEGYLDL